MLVGEPLEHGFFLFSATGLSAYEPWYHGTDKHWEALIGRLNSTVVWRSEPFGVPFSNGAQLYASAHSVLRAEFDKLATWPSLLDVFGPDAWLVYSQVERERRALAPAQ